MAEVCEERASIAQTQMAINRMRAIEQWSFPVSPYYDITFLLSQNSCYSMTDMNMQTANMIKFFRIISHLKRLKLHNYSTYHYIYNKYTFNKISQRSTLLLYLK